MSEDPKAGLFRKEADAKGLTLNVSDDDREDVETRFTFKLRRGSIVTSRHPTQLALLLKLAQEIWGDLQGEHAELVLASAPRADLHPSASPVNVTWQVTPTTPLRIEFGIWLEDQYILSKAMQLVGFP